MSMCFLVFWWGGAGGLGGAAVLMLMWIFASGRCFKVAMAYDVYLMMWRWEGVGAGVLTLMRMCIDDA